MNKRTGFVGLAVLLMSTACGGGSNSTPVSDAGARAVLSQVIGWAREGALLEHCDEIGAPLLTCERDLRSHGEDNVPAGDPVIIDSIEVPPSGSNPNHGRLLVLCGVDASGRQFQTGFLVYHDRDGDIVVPYPVYWSGAGIILSGSGNTADQPPESVRIAECEAAGAFD
jgi:hypothetical protein